MYVVATGVMPKFLPNHKLILHLVYNKNSKLIMTQYKLLNILIEDDLGVNLFPQSYILASLKVLVRNMNAVFS